MFESFFLYFICVMGGACIGMAMMAFLFAARDPDNND